MPITNYYTANGEIVRGGNDLFAPECFRDLGSWHDGLSADGRCVLIDRLFNSRHLTC